MTTLGALLCRRFDTIGADNEATVALEYGSTAHARNLEFGQVFFLLS